MKLTTTFQRLGIFCGLAVAVFATDASAQSPGPITCLPGFDLTCSPKIEVGATKATATKKAVVLKRDTLPFDASDVEVIPFVLNATGTCGEKGFECPTRSYAVGVPFSGQAASVTANVSGVVLARSSEAGSTCASLFVDLYAGKGKNSRKVLSKLVGTSCEQAHQSLFNSIVFTDLKAGESYEIRGRLECRYSKIPLAATGAGSGHFLCSSYESEVTLIWPFGVKRQ